MPSSPLADALLAVVRASPTAVAAHDKKSWVGLFAASGQLNDPVGSRPHIGEAAIGRFYETFIAPNNIAFDVDHDVVAGMSVLRDLTVHTTLSTGVTIAIPMHLRYDLVEDNIAGSFKIDRLFAYWELRAMIGELLHSGSAGLLTGAQLAPRMMATQGPGGMLGFMRGFSGVGKAGKRRVLELTTALSSSNHAAVLQILAPDARVSPDGVTDTDIGEFVCTTSGLAVEKLLASGHQVSATVHLGNRRGIGLFAFAGPPDARGAISTAHLYF